MHFIVHAHLTCFFNSKKWKWGSKCVIIMNIKIQIIECTIKIVVTWNYQLKMSKSLVSNQLCFNLRTSWNCGKVLKETYQVTYNFKTYSLSKNNTNYLKKIRPNSLPFLQKMENVDNTIPPRYNIFHMHNTKITILYCLYVSLIVYSVNEGKNAESFSNWYNYWPQKPTKMEKVWTMKHYVSHVFFLRMRIYFCLFDRVKLCLKYDPTCF